MKSVVALALGLSVFGPLAPAAPVPPEKGANLTAGTWTADAGPKGLAKVVVKEVKDGWTVQIWSAAVRGGPPLPGEWPAVPLRMVTDFGAKTGTRGLAFWDDGDCTVTAIFRVVEGKLWVERYTVWKNPGAGKDVLFEDKLAPAK